MNAKAEINVGIKLSKLLLDYLVVPKDMDLELTGIEIDSRQIQKGNLFIACQGEVVNGEDFIDIAVKKGAAAILLEKNTGNTESRDVALKKGIPTVQVENLKEKISKIAARFYAYPASSMWLIGITGTNGKTSCCEFISQAFSILGYQCGSSGTLGNGIYGKKKGALLSAEIPGTTPDAVNIQKIFEVMRTKKIDIMTMEVSSHGIDQNRVNINEFDVAVFTNLTRDHLDYHKSMDAYGEAKRQLFSDEELKYAIVNLDDSYAKEIIESLASDVERYTYSINNIEADIYLKYINYSKDGFNMELVSPWGVKKISSTLLGEFNVSNLLASITTVLATESQKEGFSFTKIMREMNSISPVAGRMEIIGEYPVSVVVDYAHTPDGLKNALQALRTHYTGRLWCVFGCGGERDQGKRPIMAAIAEEYSDECIVTDDNPRRENSDEIISQIIAGFTTLKQVTIKENRGLAIEYAITNAKKSDVILIAGKGHEQYQDVGGNRMAFSDVKQARICLNNRFKRN